MGRVLGWRVSVVGGAIIVALATFVFTLPLSSQAQQPKANAVGAFMRVKLGHSQKLLEGLALKDFDSIAKNSQAISLMSQEATWNVLQTKEYFDRSKEFRRTVDALTDAARKKNLEAAALGYVEMTMQCVHCHNYLRDVQTTGANGAYAPKSVPKKK